MSDKPERLSDERLEELRKQTQFVGDFDIWGDTMVWVGLMSEVQALVAEVIEARAKMRKCPCCNPTRRHGEMIPCDVPLDKS